MKRFTSSRVVYIQMLIGFAAATISILIVFLHILLDTILQGEKNNPMKT